MDYYFIFRRLLFLLTQAWTSERGGGCQIYLPLARGPVSRRKEMGTEVSTPPHQTLNCMFKKIWHHCMKRFFWYFFSKDNFWAGGDTIPKNSYTPFQDLGEDIYFIVRRTISVQRLERIFGRQTDAHRSCYFYIRIKCTIPLTPHNSLNRQQRNL